MDTITSKEASIVSSGAALIYAKSRETIDYAHRY